MNNKKLYYIIKADRAAKKGNKESAVRWYQRAAKESMRECQACTLFGRVMSALIIWG